MIAYGSTIWENSPDPRRSGFFYTCPDCGFVSRVMKWKQGAESERDKHLSLCPKGAP